MRRARVQMPPRRVSAGMWTGAERAAVALMIASAALVVVSLIIIGLAVGRLFS